MRGDRIGKAAQIITQGRASIPAITGGGVMVIGGVDYRITAGGGRVPYFGIIPIFHAPILLYKVLLFSPQGFLCATIFSTTPLLIQHEGGDSCALSPLPFSNRKV